MTALMNWTKRQLARLVAIFGLAMLAMPVVEADAQTRYAFLIGMNQYTNGIPQLERSTNDASDLAKDLEDLDFKHENIKVANNLKNKEEFLKSLNDFLKKVKPGDEFFFFYSGHGFAAASDNQNYLLFNNLKSIRTFAIEHMTKDEAKDIGLVNLRAKQIESDYEISEIQKVGLSEKDLRTTIAKQQPSIAIVVLDACRTLGIGDDDLYSQRVKAGLFHPKALEPGFAMIYSATYGEVAVEKTDNFSDQRRNSLFTDIFRAAIKRPGVTLDQLFSQVRDQVQAVVKDKHLPSQTPDYAENLQHDFRFIASVGAERYPIPAEEYACGRVKTDFDDMKTQMTLTRLEDFRQRYRQCREGVKATDPVTIAQIEAAKPIFRQADLLYKQVKQGDYDTTNVTPHPKRLLLSTAVDSGQKAPVASCDDLAAAQWDPTRPGNKPGVPFEEIGIKGPDGSYDTEAAIKVCDAEFKASNGRILRLKYNLARAEEAHALNPNASLSDERRKLYMRQAESDFKDLVDRNIAIAMDNLAVIYELGLAGDPQPHEAADLYRKAANAGFPTAMYHLGMKYSYGFKEGGIDVDSVQGREWIFKADEKGLAAATMEAAANARFGIGTLYFVDCLGNRVSDVNPHKAIELYEKAARLGAPKAMRLLGEIFYNGADVFQPQEKSANQSQADSKLSDKGTLTGDNHCPPSSKSVKQDYDQAFLWYARGAEAGDAEASFWSAYMLEKGQGVPAPQPTFAARFWKKSAEQGDRDAQVYYSQRILDGRILLRPDEEKNELESKLKLAVDAGEGQAALLLAQHYWDRQGGGPRNAPLAAAYAFRAIDLAARTDPSQHVYSDSFNALTEIAAGHFLIEIGHDIKARDTQGEPIIHPDELARLEKFYGKFDESQGLVPVRILKVPNFIWFNPQSYPRLDMWIWDWGRSDPPTELQFRRLELERGTTVWDQQRKNQSESLIKNNRNVKLDSSFVTQANLRDALSMVYDMARTHNLSFPDLLTSRIETSQIQSNTNTK